MTLLVRNEEDILQSNLQYHLNRGVDFVIATDNLSTDGTLDILNEYKKQNVLHLLLEPDDTYSQHKWVTRMARMASTDYQADWVINNDADEFWWLDTKTNIKEYLNAQDHSVMALSAYRHNFVPVPQDESTPFHTRMIYRETVSLNALGRPLPPKVCHRAHPEIEVMQGNHAVKCQGRELPALQSEISILHFPLRHYKQFYNKIELGGAAYARNNYLDKSVGSTWRMLYDKLQAGELEEYYFQHEYTASRIREGLMDGSLSEETCLKSFFVDLPDGISL